MSSKRILIAVEDDNGQITYQYIDALPESAQSDKWRQRVANYFWMVIFFVILIAIIALTAVKGLTR